MELSSSPECQLLFHKIKSLLSSDLLLTHFDPIQDIVVAADASSHGLRAMILHIFSKKKVKDIMYAARLLTAVECNNEQNIHTMLFCHRFTFLSKSPTLTKSAPDSSGEKKKAKAIKTHSVTIKTLASKY